MPKSALQPRPFDPVRLLSILQRYDSMLKVELGPKGSAIPTVADDELSFLVAGYNHMIEVFHNAVFKQRYGFAESGEHRLAFEESVPNYFANVGGEGIHRRKLLSIYGLRNLLKYGPIIFHGLESKKFSGREADYAPEEGLTLMRRVTGNMVDMDTVVLRCNDAPTLNAINLSNRHKGLPTHDTSAEFAQSAQAEDIAVNCGLPMLEQFCAKLKLTPSQQTHRQVCPEQIKRPVPVARNNTERGHTPIWHYVNAGQNSFHVNVPSIEDVVGALLRAPFHCLKHYAFIHSGVFPASQMPQRVDSFFEDCVVDSCFNMKWKAIEEYGEALAHEGTIVDVLQRLQMEHQTLFTPQLFDTDTPERDNEIGIMWKLVQEQKCVGREKSGAIRPITNADVVAWVRTT